MTYEDALEYIHGSLRFGDKLGLDNIRKLLELMGNPQKKLKFIHVAGTNGKGSTCAILASILKEEGYKVGMFTSPYIEAFTERIIINDEQILKMDLARITEDIKSHVDHMVKEGFNHPTEFEIVTAIGFQHFFEKNCDIVVLEVGMGGRLDSTNVIDLPLVSVITSISLDHTDYLGDTIDKIAFEKCGIIKDNGITVSYLDQKNEALEVIKKTAEERNNHFVVPSNHYKIISNDLNGIVFNYNAYENLRITLLGKHQLLNAITAITVIEVLNEKGLLRVSRESLINGLSNAKWIGRFEVLKTEPYFIIDGAHNISGIEALSDSVDAYLMDKKLTFLVGMLKDKDYEQILSIIGHKAHRIIATTPDNPRALSGEALGEVARKYCEDVIVEEEIENAITRAFECTRKDEVILCFGSLYLIGEVRRRVLCFN
ncbi:dihydrofolate synthase/folylpolyglutamate synthase [Natranaerovirga pectinivora]|uniref:tetrahydrofolate synthase n=1 Tax=Natranaerovirga pectinivora TaxID=682400 RepID=A0A4R3MTN2_9FIRM|nr:folylpolyglutamate synthase/dihydrofolate synthase family protein [Natranaerovirga pectinivora]TCT17070.1 dihydrofolate synthase/folylpolyglutamate synthase [Natranaerovirga pectinivora]